MTTIRGKTKTKQKINKNWFSIYFQHFCYQNVGIFPTLPKYLIPSPTTQFHSNTAKQEYKFNKSGKSTESHKCPTSRTKSGPHGLLNWIRIGSAHILCSSLRHFTKMAYWTQENSLCARAIVSCKGYDSGMAKWKRCIGQALGEGLNAPTHILQVYHSPNASLCAPNPVLLGFYGSFITEAWLIKSLVTGD